MNAIFVCQNNEKSAILVNQTYPLGVEFYFNTNTFFQFIRKYGR